eukprot:10621799-Lingulodinium_polyedra.AAC.1
MSSRHCGQWISTGPWALPPAKESARSFQGWDEWPLTRDHKSWDMEERRWVAVVTSSASC